MNEGNKIQSDDGGGGNTVKMGVRLHLNSILHISKACRCRRDFVNKMLISKMRNLNHRQRRKDKACKMSEVGSVGTLREP